MNKLEL